MKNRVERMESKELHEKFIHFTEWVICVLSRERGVECWFFLNLFNLRKTVHFHVRHFVWRMRKIRSFFIENCVFFAHSFFFIQRTSFLSIKMSSFSMNTLDVFFLFHFSSVKIYTVCRQCLVDIEVSWRLPQEHKSYLTHPSTCSRITFVRNKVKTNYNN